MLSVEADAVWLVLLEVELEDVAAVAVVPALSDELPEVPFSNAVRSVWSWASRDCSSLASEVAAVLVELSLLELAVVDALVALVLELLEAEPSVPSVPGGGGGGACRAANSASSALARSVEDALSLLLAEVDALLALVDALVPSVLSLDALSVENPERKLMFSSWKKAGGAWVPAWPSMAELLLPPSLLVLDELLLAAAAACSA